MKSFIRTTIAMAKRYRPTGTRKIFIIILCFIAVLINVNVLAQDGACITPDSSGKRLYLNGDNFTLIDNALRCFKLSSIARDTDSTIRIWMLEDDYPVVPVTWRVKMFEFGKKHKQPVATLYTLEWRFDKTDSSLPVTCIKKIEITPSKDWSVFNKNIRSLNLSSLYEKPWINDDVTVDYGMLIIQFVSGLTTYTVECTGIEGTSSPLQTEKLKQLNGLRGYIEKNFSVKLYNKLEHSDVIEVIGH